MPRETWKTVRHMETGVFSKECYEGLSLLTYLYKGSSKWGFFYLFGLFLEPHPWHREVPRLGVKSDLQLPAYATATAMLDPSHVCNLHYSSWQQRILNSLSKARNRTRVFMDGSWVHSAEPSQDLPQIVNQ